MFDINQFRQQLFYDGARPNLFEITLVLPSFIQPDVSRSITFMAKATQLPPSILGTARVSYFGRDVKLPGDRQFPDWNITIINDETFNIRAAFEDWVNKLNGSTTMARDFNTPIQAMYGYAVDATVKQLSKKGGIARQYTFRGLFPTQVDPINLSWDARDQIEEFGVNFSYQYWEDTTPGASISKTLSTVFGLGTTPGL